MLDGLWKVSDNHRKVLDGLRKVFGGLGKDLCQIAWGMRQMASERYQVVL